LSNTRERLTQHIGPNIDAERDLLLRDLRGADMVEAFFQISGMGPALFARKDEGDPCYTDGEINVAGLVVDGAKERSGPQRYRRRR
jgi:hypothetical protein